MEHRFAFNHLIRQGTQAGELIGDDCVREEIQVITEQRVMRYPHGGDRKSARFRSGRDDI